MNLSDRNHDQEHGFSMLEAVMGIVLLALVFVGLSTYSGSQWKALKKSGDMVEAAQVGITTLENELVSLSDSAQFATTYQATSSTPVTTTSSDTGANAIYTVNISRSRLPASNNLLVLKATISWTGGHSTKINTLAVKP